MPFSIGVERGLSKLSKIGLKEFRILHEVEVMIRLPDVYQMSEDGIYPSRLFSYPFWGMSVLGDARSCSNFGGRGGLL